MEKEHLEKTDYPLVMEVDHVKEILGVSKRRAYEIMDIDGFPLIKLGRNKRVYRDRFFLWLEEKSE